MTEDLNEDDFLDEAVARASGERARLLNEALADWGGYPKRCPEGHCLQAPHGADDGELCAVCGASYAVVQSCSCSVVCDRCQRAAEARLQGADPAAPEDRGGGTCPESPRCTADAATCSPCGS